MFGIEKLADSKLARWLFSTTAIASMTLLSDGVFNTNTAEAAKAKSVSSEEFGKMAQKDISELIDLPKGTITNNGFIILPEVKQQSRSQTEWVGRTTLPGRIRTIFGELFTGDPNQNFIIPEAVANRIVGDTALTWSWGRIKGTNDLFLRGTGVPKVVDNYSCKNNYKYGVTGSEHTSSRSSSKLYIEQISSSEINAMLLKNQERAGISEAEDVASVGEASKSKPDWELNSNHGDNIEARKAANRQAEEVAKYAAKIKAEQEADKRFAEKEAKRIAERDAELAKDEATSKKTPTLKPAGTNTSHEKNSSKMSPEVLKKQVYAATKGTHFHNVKDANGNTVTLTHEAVKLPDGTTWNDIQEIANKATGLSGAEIQKFKQIKWDAFVEEAKKDMKANGPVTNAEGKIISSRETSHAERVAQAGSSSHVEKHQMSHVERHQEQLRDLAFNGNGGGKGRC